MTNAQTVLDLKPGVMVTVAGRPATVISSATAFHGRPSRFVQFEDGSHAQVVVEDGTPKVVADAAALRQRTRLFNALMTGGARLQPVWRACPSDNSNRMQAVQAALVHLFGCACPGPLDGRRLCPDDITDLVVDSTVKLLNYGGSTRTVPSLAPCVVEAAGDSPLGLPGVPIEALIGAQCTYGRTRFQVIEADAPNIVIETLPGRFRRRYTLSLEKVYDVHLPADSPAA